MSEVASGVAICNTGLPMTGLEGTMGKVDDLGRSPAAAFLDPFSALLLPKGRVLVLDSNGIVVEDEGDVTEDEDGDDEAFVGLDGDLMTVAFSALTASEGVVLTSLLTSSFK